MPFNPAALISILPQFIIGGIVAIYFYSALRKLSSPKRKMEFFVKVDDSSDEPLVDDAQNNVPEDDKEVEPEHPVDALMNLVEEKPSETKNSTENAEPAIIHSTPYTRPVTDTHPVLADTQLILLSLDLWILVTLLLSPIRSLTFMLPSLSATDSELLYPILAGLLSIAVMTTLISRLEINRKIMAIMLISAGIVTFGAFYAPSMSWINALSGFFRIVVIYSAVVLVCMTIFVLASYMKKMYAFRASAYTSFASYGITTFILFLNVFSVFP